MQTNHICRRYVHVRHPALARVHLATTDRADDDLQSLCGGRSCGWQRAVVEPGDERDICGACRDRREVLERARAWNG